MVQISAVAASMCMCLYKWSDFTDWLISNLTRNFRCFCFFQASFIPRILCLFVSTLLFCVHICIHLFLSVVIFLCDWLSSPSRTRSTNSRRDAELPPPKSSHYLQSRLSLWLFVWWRVEVSWRIGAWQAATQHSLLHLSRPCALVSHVCFSTDLLP